MTATFSDDAPGHFGSGWNAGLAALFLACLGCCAVLALHFPAALSTPGFREQLPFPLVRWLIDAALVLAIVLGTVNVALRARKALGIAAILLAGLGELAGGGRVPLDTDLDATHFIGLDWLAVSLLTTTIVFVPLEQLAPRNRGQPIFRFGWATDTGHLLLSHLAVQAMTVATMAPAMALVRRLEWYELWAFVARQPLALQVFEMLLVADFVQVLVHRAFHLHPRLWPFHAVHHSTRHLDWLAGSRLHLVDALVTRAVILVPIALLGFSRDALLVWVAIVSVHALLNHANLDLRGATRDREAAWTSRTNPEDTNPSIGSAPAAPRWWEYVIVTPRYHHWHHALTPHDKNFAVHFPVFDLMLGTFHLPATAWPARLGVDDPSPPEGTLAQLAWPFWRGARPPRP